jgi:hypothetical protein
LFVDLPRVRLDGGAKAFRQRWGYELSPPPPLLEEEEGEGCEAEAEGEGEPAETASLREEGTLHTLSPLGEYLPDSPYLKLFLKEGQKVSAL